MENSKLLDIIKVQSEIIDLLVRDYTSKTRNPIEKTNIDNLNSYLKDLLVDLKK